MAKKIKEVKTLLDIKNILVKINDDTLDGMYFGTGEGSEDLITLVAVETGEISEEQIGFPEVFYKYKDLGKLGRLIDNIIKAQRILDKETDSDESEIADEIMEEGISSESKFEEKK